MLENKTILFLVLSLFVISCSSTEKTTDSKKTATTENYISPKFAYNTKKQIAENLADYSRESNCNIKQLVVVKFIITKNSKIKKVTFSQKLPIECKQVIRRTINDVIVISPGIINGRAVDVQYKLPLRFQ